MIIKYILLFCLLLCSQTQSFAGLNLDPNLVAATTNAMSNLRGMLAIFSCSGNALFDSTARGAGGFNMQRYVLYTVVQTVVRNLQSIVRALRANNIVVGANSMVQGTKNILIGNNGIVSGHKLWVFSCTQTVTGSGLLVLGNFRIDLKNAGALMHNPTAVIQCLNPNQSNDYFAKFGVNAQVGAAAAAQVNQIKIMI